MRKWSSKLFKLFRRKHLADDLREEADAHLQMNGKRYRVLIANMGTVVMPLVGNTKYPQITGDFARSFQAQKKLSPDIWVAAHAAQYGMQEKFKAGSFVDPEGYKQAVDRYEKMFRERLAKEQRETR